MAMNNNKTYNLQVIWGKYLVNHDEEGNVLNPPELKWCWKAIATVVTPVINVYPYPVGWTPVDFNASNITKIETYTYTWADMSNLISALDTFWDPEAESTPTVGGNDSEVI